MGKPKHLWIATIVLILLAIAVYVSARTFQSSTGEQPMADVLIQFPNGYSIHVALADTPTERMLGLGNWDSIGSDEGILFIHPIRGFHTYWMKDVEFPIDVIWLDTNTIVGLTDNLQPEEPPVTLYTPPVPANRVLEVQAGFIAKNNLLIGDHLDITLPEQ